MAHPNADLVRRGFEAFAAGDMATLGQLFADDAKWHASGRGPVSGDFEGKEAIFGNFAQVQQETDSIQQDLHAVLADDEHAVALVNATFTRSGKTLTGQQVFVFHVAGGQVAEAWIAPLDQYAADDFWAG